MRLKAQDWIDPNPAILSGNFLSAYKPDEYFADELLDPGLKLDSLTKGLPLQQVKKVLANNALQSILTLQQFVVRDIAVGVGVLGPFVPVTQKALQAVFTIIDAFDEDVVFEQALSTAIGACGQVLSAVPTIYTQIAGGILSMVSELIALFAGPEDPQLPVALLPCQQWSEETDSYQFNTIFRTHTQVGYDYTGIFSPRFEGDLTMQVCTNDADMRAFVWALGNGTVPRIGGWEDDTAVVDPSGTFHESGGLGMIPGGQRIYAPFQTTIIDPSAYYPTVYDPRCGKYGGFPQYVQGNDVGNFYPTCAQAGESLWDFLFQRGAACYTVDAFGLSDIWHAYSDAIYNGVDRLWGDSKYTGNEGNAGWGAGAWEPALTELLLNYCTGMNGVIGGIGTPVPKGCTSRLTDEYAAVWAKNSVFTKIILPALGKLAAAQQWYLDHTTIAAYLPVNGGVDADPLAQQNVMGAFRGTGAKNLRKRFVDARKRILNGSQKFEVRLDDVLDATYKAELKQHGGGTQGIGSIVAIVPGVEAWTPTGGQGSPSGSGSKPKDGSPNEHRLSVRDLGLASAAVSGAGFATWYFHDDLRRVATSLRRMVRRR